MQLSQHYIYEKHTVDFHDRLAPFADGGSLPDCVIDLYEKADGKTVFADSAFSRYIDAGELPGAVTAGDYSFAPCGDGIAVRDSRCALVWVHDSYRKIDAVIHKTDIYAPILAQVLMQAYRYTLLFAGGLLVHSACVVKDGGAVLFCGVPGAGKSTQARLWEQVLGAEALNNDQTAVLWDKETVLAHGTPWSGKEPCYKNEGYPLRAIVFVEKSPTNRVELLRPAEGFGLLYLNNYAVPARDGIEEAYSAAVEKLTQSVPIYRQYCTMTETAPKTLLQELER